jgi:DNA-directed RNA polymerase subunit RPC12/RpoP
MSKTRIQEYVCKDCGAPSTATPAECPACGSRKGYDLRFPWKKITTTLRDETEDTKTTETKDHKSTVQLCESTKNKLRKMWGQYPTPLETIILGLMRELEERRKADAEEAKKSLVELIDKRIKEFAEKGKLNPL